MTEISQSGKEPRRPGADATLLASLTPSQQEAVRHIHGPQLILAGPGSGKTRVVTHRIAYMLEEGIAEQDIVALTFTNKAADEMRQRVAQLCPGRGVWIGTFHRFCAQHLRQYAPLVGLKENYSILDTDDSLKLLREAIVDAHVELIHETPGKIATAISWAKNELITADDYVARPGNPIGTLVQRIYPCYQRRLLAANAVDFDDLLMHVALLLRDNPDLRRTLDQRHRYIMVDEYQDTNVAQYAIVRTLSRDFPNLSVTGDPDQSIYGWRGATVRNILEFERDYPKVHVVCLEENFRSTKLILSAADTLIANNKERKEKSLHTRNAEGKPVRLAVHATGRQEVDAIAARIANDVAGGRRRYRDFAIFYRTNSLSRGPEQALRALGIPYQVVRALEFYQRKEVKDILAYLQLLNNPANDVALLRIINTPPRKIGKTTIGRLTDFARRHGLPLFEAARQAGLIESLGKRTAVEVARFVALIDALQVPGSECVEDLMRKVVELSEYRQWLVGAGTEEDAQRVENLDELLSDAREFDETHPEGGGLEAFLEQASLVADIDQFQTTSDCVTMMTLHAAKGLEFPVVFIIAVEDDVLPHMHSKDQPQQLEEERRLLFVGMTRAEEELYLSAAQQRMVRGETKYRVTSPFLMELPREEMEVVGSLGYGGSVDASCSDPDAFVEPEYAEAWDEAEWGCSSELEFDEQLQRAASRKKGRRRAGDAISSTAASAGVPLLRAAEMLDDASPGASCPPETFREGMVVIHPQHGIGKILTVAGSGKKRAARVQFTGEERTRSFQLAFSPLRPLAT